MKINEYVSELARPVVGDVFLLDDYEILLMDYESHGLIGAIFPDGNSLLWQPSTEFKRFLIRSKAQFVGRIDPNFKRFNRSQMIFALAQVVAKSSRKESASATA